VHTLQGQRGSYGRQPSLAPLMKRMRVAVSEPGSLAQPHIKIKGQTLCHSAAVSRHGSRARGGLLATGYPKTSRQLSLRIGENIAHVPYFLVFSGEASECYCLPCRELAEPVNTR
jgi:hypothetical protein